MLSWEHIAHKGPPRYSLYWPHWVPFKQRKGVGFFCLFVWFLFALCAWQVHKSSYLRLPSNLGRQVIITPILWMSR